MNNEKKLETTNLEDSLLEDAELAEARGCADTFAQFLGAQGNRRLLVEGQRGQLQWLRPGGIKPNASYITEIITDKPKFDAALVTQATNLLTR